MRFLEEKLKYTHLIWDFNGTILDDVDIGIEAANVLLKRRNLPLMNTRAEYQRLFRFPIIEYYKDAGFDFEKESFDDVAIEWVTEYLARMPRTTIFAGVQETMAEVRARGIPQILLSATKLEMLKKQVEDIGLTHAFSEIYGLDHIHATSKKALAEQLRARYPDGRLLFVGDTDHDLEVAQAARADCILFAGGHQSPERLKKLGCPVIEKIPDLLLYL